MSIHLTCYTTYKLVDLQKKIKIFRNKYPEIFPEHYYLSTAGALHPIQQEIANEFGLDACSYFLVSVNNKSLTISTDTMANLIRKEFGKESVIILHNGEDLI
ncbi:hypothetical protein ACILPN_01420 [Yersinia wautersii]|uniref:Uncharacterized protein n=1 Tax=Yersinia pseudotuberculosis TaxID=633 RepID=A0A380QE71_YERPU|nr:hypothetical protein [Yersinia pseudotuberculosis]SUP86151.1 Uncharacterised protein [Yersinia pseudotuberculosis]